MKIYALRKSIGTNASDINGIRTTCNEVFNSSLVYFCKKLDEIKSKSDIKGIQYYNDSRL